MAGSKSGPECGPPPQLNQPKEILEHLLTVELDRLETARRIEKERSIVFPETSIIIRDIVKLMGALGMKTDCTEIGVTGINMDIDFASVVNG